MSVDLLDIEFDVDGEYGEVHAHREFKYQQGAYFFNAAFECVGHDGTVVSKKALKKQKDNEEALRRAESSGKLGDLGGVVIGNQGGANENELRENAQAQAAEDAHG